MLTLLTGDCREVMRGMDANSVDAIVTDPPYHLTTGKKGGSGPASDNPNSPAGRARITTGFMGKKWDGGDIAHTPAVWIEALRVAKPGAYLLAFGGTRTFHRLAVAIEDAGWEFRDTIMWVYGSGFPKSLDVSKAIDKAAARVNLSFAAHYSERRKAAGLSHAQVCDLGHFYAEVNHGGLSVNWESGYATPTRAQWTVIQPALNLDHQWAPELATDDDDRRVTRAASRPAVPGEAITFDQRSSCERERRDIPATDDARKWQGWGTALKPAWEPIIVARKPLEGTVAANVQKHGTGGLNIDACRIGWPDGVAPEIGTPEWGGPRKKSTAVPGQDGETVDREPPSNLGRWPANLIHDGGDEVMALFPTVASGQPCGMKAGNNNNVFGQFAGGIPVTGFGDSGSAARFFYTAKADREDRNAGCERMPKKPLNWSSGDQSPGTFQAEGTDRTAHNNHPTVKPNELMRYLCRLVTPRGGIVLDPFMGSGSTGKAAVMEGFRFVGIEIDPEYIEIARARIMAAQPGLPLA